MWGPYIRDNLILIRSVCHHKHCVWAICARILRTCSHWQCYEGNGDKHRHTLNLFVHYFAPGSLDLRDSDGEDEQQSSKEPRSHERFETQELCRRLGYNEGISRRVAISYNCATDVDRFPAEISHRGRDRRVSRSLSRRPEPCRFGPST